MAQMSQNTETGLRYDKTLFTSPLVQVRKTFQAPLEKVWKAWSTPELIKQWWGPAHFSCPEAQITFKVGGQYIFAMKDNQTGNVSWSTGVYEQIIPGQKLAFTDHFSDERGNYMAPADYGMTGNWPEVMYVTVTFGPLSPYQTRIELTHEGIPAEQHDDCVAGWSSSLDKMKKLVARIS
ncbi:MAG: SRPBCC domain-containing protein [Bdellovibrionaceae bacterium]|nr:SRPBCC domain-containing protein [Pseudobdellovibrionaceae bacterium]